MTEDVSKMSLIIGSNEKAIKQIIKDGIDFFKYAMQVFDCSESLVSHIEQQKLQLLKASSNFSMNVKIK